MKRISGFLVLVGVASLLGCASGPSAPSAPAAAAPTAATPVVAKTSSVDAPTGATSVEKPPRGYERVMMNGNEMFCRNDLVTGSRTERQKVCLTADELKKTEDASQTFLDDVQRHGGASTFNGGRAN